MPTGKRPTEEITDYMGKVTLVPNSSYLFSAGTIGAPFTTTQQTPILSAHPTHFPSTLPGHIAAPTPAATLPTTHVPYNMPTTLHTTHIPPYNPHNFTSTFPTLVHHPIPPHPLSSHQP